MNGRKPFDDHLRLAMRNAPRESVTVITIGSSSGVRPTARATANRNDSRRAAEGKVSQQHEQHQEDGQSQDQQAKSVNAALKGARRLIAGERRGDTAEASGAAVATTSMVASPLTTDVPANSALKRRPAWSASQAPDAFFAPGTARPSSVLR